MWQAFESAALRFADRTAVEVQRADRIESWTYRRLHANAVAQSQLLAAHGVERGDRCAILADNDAPWCAAYLGTLRLGAVVVPLDTNYSAEQVAAIIHDAAPDVLLVDQRHQDVAGVALAGSPDTKLVTLEAAVVAAGAPTLPAAGGSAVDVAVISYTSGTTADPKGVVLTHANLLAERDAALTIVTVSEHDSVLGVLPLFHSLAQTANLLLPFLVGARVVFLETVNSTELIRALGDRQITIFCCVPQFFYLIHQRVLDEVAKGNVLKRVLFRKLMAANFALRRNGLNLGPRVFGRVHALTGRQMRFFLTGGSKFDPRVGRDLYSLGFTILQAYGLTETSGAATLTSPDEAHLDTVGRPLPGHQIRIVPSEDPGLDGEIAIAGPIVMQGYYNKPDATAAVLRDGWLLTGDLGHVDSDGRLTITGRKKEVIVLASGKNIYPEEIERYYLKSSFVKEVCVLGIATPDDPTTERLFAVVVPDMDLIRTRRVVNTGDLMRFEMEGQSIHLPPHKRVLGYDLWFEPLPRTTTGKLRRHEIARRVRVRHTEQIHRAAEQRLPFDWGDDTHAAVAAALIARRAKGAVPRPESSLELDLGLDSIERVELFTELESRFGVRIADEDAVQILTVQHVIDAVRPGAGQADAPVAEDSWDVILRDLPPIDDPELKRLIRPRPFAGPLWFVVLRTLRLLLPGLKVTNVGNLPTTGPIIISPNHQGFLDPFLVCASLPYPVFRRLFFVGAADFFESRLMLWVGWQFNLVPVDPDAHLIPAMKAAAFGLAHGKALMLFPEGERSIDGTVKRFKKGAVILSRQLQVPIVPVAIRGAFELWPRNRGINWKMLMPWSGHRIHLSYGRPVAPDRAISYDAAASTLREDVDGMWQRLQ